MKKIWDTVFKKPPPVQDLQAWLKTRESEKFVYLPNNLKKHGKDSEEYISNAQYTEVMLNSYKEFCKKLEVNPKVILPSGVVLSIRSLSPLDGVQPTVECESASRLANSTLYDFNDSKYYDIFIQCLKDLTPGMYENDGIKVRVLARVEVALLGSTEHLDNQKFASKYLSLISEVLSVKAIPIIQSMIMDGQVLEDSLDDFKVRIARMNMLDSIKELVKTYEDCCKR